MKSLFRSTSTLPCMLMLLLALALGTTTSSAQFHAGVDIKYSFGLGENDLANNNTAIDNTNSISIAVSGLYEFNTVIWAGVGLNTNINNKHIMIIDENNTVNSMPIMQFAPYLTLRYRAAKHPNLYLFTDIGYAIPFKNSQGVQTFSEGAMWNAGIGYSYMFKKHFGLNCSVGYNLQQIKGTPCAPQPGGGNYIAQNNVRHSIGIAIGVIF